MLHYVRNQASRFYINITLVVTLGWAWLIYALSLSGEGNGLQVCWFKNITSLPCPSCGTTRSLLAICHGEFYHALLINPLGYVASVLAITMPLWLLYDILNAKGTIYIAFQLLNKLLKKKIVLITLLSIIAVNWIWNIYKM
ncbi:MAG: DUF2752 domain-containing protein [Bacteroidetes bacterium]|nr:DUF2752 domain-containing protein [Bacteroidota bacterium]